MRMRDAPAYLFYDSKLARAGGVHPLGPGAFH
jgi:hypothetical protein